jgi:nickel/cobalt exporter
MAADIVLLAVNAAAVGLIHTVTGPDHYLPFIVMAKARRWSVWRTASITLACGVGHVGSSVVLGMIGLACGWGLHRLKMIESARGDWAAWALVVFGTAYCVWGLRRAWQQAPRGFIPIAAGSRVHAAPHRQTQPGHSHGHGGFLHSHDHIHASGTGEAVNLTPWILFTVFVLGPCEPLIPLFIYPAAKDSWIGAWIVALVFGVVTIGAMLGLVLGCLAGLERIPLHWLERFSHALAGASIASCGCAILLLGL